MSVTFTPISVGAAANAATVNTPLQQLADSAQTELDLKANIAGPTFTGTVVLPATTSIGTVSSTEIGYIDGVTSAVQTQLDSKAPAASPTFTGTVTASGASAVVLPAATSIGTITSTELGYVDGVTSAIQTQLDAKSSTAHKATHVSGGTDAFVAGDRLNANARTVVKVEGASIGDGNGRRAINFKYAGSGVSIYASDNSVDEQTDLTFTFSGGASSGTWPLTRVLTVDVSSTETGNNYNTLSAAVGAAVTGDIILLGSGNYTCNNVLVTKDIEIVGMGMNKSVLTTSSSQYCVTLSAGAKLTNLTLNVSTAGGVDAAGALITTVAATLTNVNSIVSSTATDTSGFHNQIAGTKFTNCTSTVSAGTNKYGIKSTATFIENSGNYNDDYRYLKEWTEGEDYELTAITRDANDIATTATVKWPDGSAGTFTTVTPNTTWYCIDAYTITHTNSGKTITQTAPTRNSAGSITVKPALTIA